MDLLVVVTDVSCSYSCGQSQYKPDTMASRGPQSSADEVPGRSNGSERDSRTELLAVNVSSLETRVELIFANLAALETRMDRALGANVTAAAVVVHKEEEEEEATLVKKQGEIAEDAGGERGREYSSSVASDRRTSKYMDASSLAEEIESLRAAQLRLKIDHEVAQST